MWTGFVQDRERLKLKFAFQCLSFGMGMLSNIIMRWPLSLMYISTCGVDISCLYYLLTMDLTFLTSEKRTTFQYIFNFQEEDNLPTKDKMASPKVSPFGISSMYKACRPHT